MVKASAKNRPEPGESLLLHVCCAPCAAGCVERLLANYRKVGFYFSNSNLATEEEFEKRLSAVEKLAELFSVPLWVDRYDHGSWLRNCAPFAGAPEGGERCLHCFRHNLGRTAGTAAGLGFETFATSLTVSPLKSSAAVFAEAADFPAFRPWNFKKESGYLRGRAIARENGFYLQNFCGCEFSRRNPSSSSGTATPPADTRSE